jgi:hypothetical protein
MGNLQAIKQASRVPQIHAPATAASPPPAPCSALQDVTEAAVPLAVATHATVKAERLGVAVMLLAAYYYAPCRLITTQPIM